MEARYFEFHVVDHCNLNCKGCTHFCPLIEDETAYDAEVLADDLAVIARHVNFEMVRIMGGEPLLHPELPRIMDDTRKIFPRSDIRVVTNGILIRRQNDAFFDSLRRNRIAIDISHYPVFSDDVFKKLVEWIGQKGASVNALPRFKFSVPFKLSPSPDPAKNFEACANKNCKVLIGRRLYPCAQSAQFRFFNEKFGESVSCHPGVEVATATPDQIKAIFTHGGIPTCAYCDFKEVRYYNWEVSRRERNEWLAYDVDLLEF